jgi:DNA-directed RNA polymerase specialized sigma subunit
MSLYKDIAITSKKHKILSKKEERVLIAQYQKTGDTIFRDSLIKSNLKMIVNEAKKFHMGNSMNPSLFMELISVCFQEATECIDRYKPTKGNGSVCSFIRNSISMALRNFSRCNIENGEFLMLHKPSNRYSEYKEEEFAASYFSQKEGRYPIQGEMLPNKNGGKPLQYMAKGRTNIVSIEPILYTCEHTDIDIEQKAPTKYLNYKLYDNDSHDKRFNVLKNHINTFSLREREVYEYEYVQNMKKQDILLNISPITESDMEKCESTGSNFYTLESTITYDINIISYLNNTKTNDLTYDDGEVMFDYHSLKNNVYIIHTTSEFLNPASFFRVKDDTYAIYNKDCGDIISSHDKLKQGYCITLQQLKRIGESILSNIRLNKQLMTQLYE